MERTLVNSTMHPPNQGDGTGNLNVPALMATYQLRQREYLVRITRAMTSRLDLPSLLKLILNSAAEMVGCRIGLIALRQDGTEVEALRNRPLQYRSTHQLQIRAIYGISPNALPAFAPLLAAPPFVEEPSSMDAGRQSSTGDIDDADDISTILNAYFFDLQERVGQVEEKLGSQLGKVIGLPLLLERELLGIIYLFREEYAFTQSDWQFLQAFADQAAIAVRNARLYQQLETERSRLATIIQNSADGIMILDADLQVLVINQALANLLGIASEAAIARPYHEVMTFENLSGVDIAEADDLTSFFANLHLHCEGDLQLTANDKITVSVNYTPLYDENNQLVNVIVNVYDITRFRQEEEIKSTFTSIISHELKTPVALIKGYAQTLARPDATWDAETARQGLQIIEEEADRLEGLINNLLDASRIQASGLRLDYADVNIAALLKKVADRFRVQSPGHEIVVDFGQKLPLIWGDEERLRQVVTNLVSNAIKYSPNGKIIRMGGWSETASSAQERPTDLSTNVIFYVADQGIGIPSEELPYIFERFYRVDSGLRRSTAGTGLGLFLSKEIVEAHGGQIWVRSEPGIGTTFFVALPTEEGQVSQDIQQVYSLPYTMNR
ncbi:MAG: ATP-binding protein [Chloroflexota bacterium]